MKIIKKYSNRRMYDAEESKIVTLEDIAEYIRKDIDIKIIDNNTDEDITTKVLLRTLLKIDREADKDSKIKNSLLKNIIKDYVDKPLSVLKRLTFAGVGLTEISPKDIEKFFAYLIRQGKESNQYGAEIVKNGIDKASSDIKKEAKNLAENIYKGLSKFKLFELNSLDNKNNKEKEEKKTTTESVKRQTKKLTEDEKDIKIEQLEREVKMLKDQLNKTHIDKNKS